MSRGLSELALSKLPAEERKEAVVAALAAFKRFNFYPEQVRCCWERGKARDFPSSS
jgi:hypothetical protein